MCIARPAIARHWKEVMANNSFTALLSVTTTSEQPPIDAGLMYGLMYNDSGGYVTSKPSMTSKIPQIAGSCGWPSSLWCKQTVTI